MPTETEKEEIGRNDWIHLFPNKPERTTNGPWQMLTAAFFKRSINKS